MGIIKGDPEKAKAKKEKAKAKKEEKIKKHAEYLDKLRILSNYDYHPYMFIDGDDEALLGRIQEYEEVRDKHYDSVEEEKLELLRLISKQNLLILAELKKINYNIPEKD